MGLLFLPTSAYGQVCLGRRNISVIVFILIPGPENHWSSDQVYPICIIIESVSEDGGCQEMSMDCLAVDVRFMV